MAIKFPLKMADGAMVKTIEELRGHFDVASVLGYYKDGRLVKWLRNGYYDMEAERIDRLDSASDCFKTDLCKILGVACPISEVDRVELSDVTKKNERLELLKKYTADESMLEAIDSVAFTQEELVELLDKKLKIIYLCGEKFALPIADDMVYIGINNPVVYIPYTFSVHNCVDVEYLDDIEERNSKFAWERGLNPFQSFETTSKVHRVKVFTANKPIVLWRDLAEQGKATAELELAEAYYYGEGIEQNKNEAGQWYRKAAEHGNAKAQFALAEFYVRPISVPEYEEPEYIYWISKAAEQGECNSLRILGESYLTHGYYDFPFDYGKAFECFLKAAEKGHKICQLYVAQCYAFGRGISYDLEQSLRWYMEAYTQGDENIRELILDECYSIGMSYFSYEGYLLSYIESGMGHLYDNADNREFQQDYEKAVLFFRVAAERGQKEAQRMLGDCYYQGKGVEQDYKVAVNWYFQAAKQGDAEAQKMIGDCYSYARGVPKNREIALDWYSKAANQNNADAKYKIGKYYEEQADGEKNIMATAFDWYGRAAELGHEKAKADEERLRRKMESMPEDGSWEAVVESWNELKDDVADSLDDLTFDIREGIKDWFKGKFR